MKKAIPATASFDQPAGAVEDSKMHDAEAEAVIKFAEQEQQAEEEKVAMERNDPLRLQAQAVQPTVFDDDVPANPDAGVVIDPGAVAAEHSSVPMDPGLMVPTTPPRTFAEVESQLRLQGIQMEEEMLQMPSARESAKSNVNMKKG